MLHTVNKSPFASATLTQCLGHLTDGAAVLLIEDAVVGGVAGTAPGALLAECLKGHKVYCLGPDLMARGISEGRLVKGIQTVDYAGFVRLVTEHDAVQSWL
ncbi:sulfurtransferase complex subunit TusB [Acidiferrobacter sp.]|jgi:tRNA 2-thiouridine synthesizing protein B|uniref:sulfurtransferase complex subunit TusB n=1 Tax=Acidiferrobacter sp. TaxID=1872107 RepID=UPI002637075F|nr:sulfurtransferase complex subunit TusB [Acidiferrobacter sp.]